MEVVQETETAYTKGESSMLDVIVIENGNGKETEVYMYARRM